jgi:hypothetical protein
VSNKSDVTDMSQRTAKYNLLALYSLVDSNEFQFSSWWKHPNINLPFKSAACREKNYELHPCRVLNVALHFS